MFKFFILESAKRFSSIVYFRFKIHESTSYFYIFGRKKVQNSISQTAFPKAPLMPGAS